MVALAVRDYAVDEYIECGAPCWLVRPGETLVIVSAQGAVEATPSRPRDAAAWWRDLLCAAVCDARAAGLPGTGRSTAIPYAHGSCAFKRV
jgi:hypothetical protein